MTVRRERALLLFEQRRHELAEQELRLALADEPDDPLSHALLALCLAARERLDEATREAEAAVGLAPDFAFAHYAMASVLAERRRFPQARAAVAEAIRLDPEQADYFAVLAQTHFAEDRWREALTAADEGLAVDPEHAGCLNLRAMALRNLGRKAEAAAALGSALERDPENAVTHANQGWAYLHRGERVKALEHFREALRLDPELEWARLGIVEALKARNPVYGVMLRYFLWMSRLDRRTQWLVIVGAYVVFRALRGIAQSNPALAPWVMPLTALYMAFVVLTWIADPLFNLLLRFNRFGRLALSREQVVAANWVGAALGLAAVAVGLALAAGGDAALAALGALMLVIPLAGTFKCQPGWPRRAMAAITAALAVTGAAALGTALAGGPPRLAGTLALLFFIGAGLSTWIANALAGVMPER